MIQLQELDVTGKDFLKNYTNLNLDKTLIQKVDDNEVENNNIDQDFGNNVLSTQSNFETGTKAIDFNFVKPSYESIITNFPVIIEPSTIVNSPVIIDHPTIVDFPIIIEPLKVKIDLNTTKFDLNFSSSGQSIWGLGTGKFVDNRFLGASWNKSGKKTFAKVGVYGSTEGKVGLQSDFELDGGSVNVNLPIDLTLNLPDKVTPGETITIKSGFTVDSAAKFETTNPYFDYDLDFIFNVDAEAGVTAFGKRKSIFNFDRNYTRNLLDLDSNNAKFSVSEKQLDGFGSFDVRVPKFKATGTKIDRDSLKATNNDTFLNASLDLDKFATSIFALPSLEGSFDKSIGKWGFKVGAKGKYNLLDVELESKLNLRQEFGLNVDELTGQLVLENGDRINFTVGEDITFTVPEGIGDSLEVDAILGVDANFRNRTRLGFDVDLDIEALSLSGEIKIPGPNPKLSVGPLYDRNFNLFDTEFDLYNRSFDLGGFNTQSLSFSLDARKVFRGTDGDDHLIGSNGDDFIDGLDGNDRLIGRTSDDILNGGAGNDILYGGSGNDTVTGGLGNDGIVGTDYASEGTGEIDTLTSGSYSDRDRFLLGQSDRVFYDDRGVSDYARITDFDIYNYSGEVDYDSFRIVGSVSDYSINYNLSSQDTSISYGGDLIAIVENADLTQNISKHFVSI